MNVEFKYSLDDNVVFRDTKHDDAGYIIGTVKKRGRIFQAEICGSMNLFGLKPEKPYICYKVQIGGGWTHVNEKDILRKI